MKTINLDTIKTKITEIKETVRPVERLKSLEVSDLKETPYSGMIASAFWMAGKLPLAGKVATKVFEKSDFEVKSKDFANKFFNPFYVITKLKTVKN
jgi:hypothetical protein